MKLNLSIIVVTYNQRLLVERFHTELTSSLAEFSDWEILYCDHSPFKDVYQSLAHHPSPPKKLFHNPQNPGFAAGVNFLILHASKKWIALLNPDVFGFTADFWEALLTVREQNMAIFALLRDSSGNPTDCYGSFPSLVRPLLNLRKRLPPVRQQSIDTGIMAFMLTAAHNFQKVGLLDEEYFMYAEDMDWCFRAKRHSMDVVIEPRLNLIHLGSQSALTRNDEQAILIQKYQAERIFLKKHYKGINLSIMLYLNSLKQAIACKK